MHNSMCRSQTPANFPCRELWSTYLMYPSTCSIKTRQSSHLDTASKHEQSMTQVSTLHQEF
eukprot:c48391_g1_i1 orf=3-182(-)